MATTTTNKSTNDLATVVRWIRKNCKATDSYQDAKKRGAKKGISVYPRAWGAAWKKLPLKAKITKPAKAAPVKAKAKAKPVKAKAAAKRKPAKHQGVTLLLERNGESIALHLHNPHLSLEDGVIRITDKG